MHEMSVARGIIDVVGRHLPAGGGSVKTVRLRIGMLAGVVPASLEFCFDALTPGTGLDGARLVMESVPVTARCGSCGAVTGAAFPFRECPACGADRLEMATGTELEVSAIELDDGERAER